MKNYLEDKTVLITGGTGSFGGTACKFLLNLGAKEIRIFSRDEKKQDSMRRRFNSETIKFYLGDVRDEQSLERSMNGVDFIFHACCFEAGAFMRVFPSGGDKDQHPRTENVIRQAMNANVKKVVCLSSDKAVYPVNAMGLTKALMENLLHQVSITRTTLRRLSVALDMEMYCHQEDRWFLYLLSRLKWKANHDY